MNSLRALTLLGAALLATGCTSYRAVDKNASATGGETIFVLGVSPDDFRVKVFPGEVKDGPVTGARDSRGLGRFAYQAEQSATFI